MTDTECHHQLIWPQVLQLMGPAIFVVFVFGLTNLEVSLILGPDQPQLIGVRLLQLLTDPDATNRQAGAQGLLILLIGLGVAWLLCRPLLRPHTKNRLPLVWSFNRLATLLRYLSLPQLACRF